MIAVSPIFTSRKRKIIGATRLINTRFCHQKHPIFRVGLEQFERKGTKKLQTGHPMARKYEAAGQEEIMEKHIIGENRISYTKGTDEMGGIDEKCPLCCGGDCAERVGVCIRIRKVCFGEYLIFLVYCSRMVQEGAFKKSAPMLR